MRNRKLIVESLESRSLLTHWYPMGMVGPVPTDSQFYTGTVPPGAVHPLTAAPPAIYLSSGSTYLPVGSRFAVAVASTDPSYKFSAVDWKVTGPGDIIQATPPGPFFDVNESSSIVTTGGGRVWNGTSDPYPGIATWGAYFGATVGTYTVKVTATYSDGTKPAEADLKFTISAPTVEYVRATGTADKFGNPPWRPSYIGFYHTSQIDAVRVYAKVDAQPQMAGSYGFIQLVKSEKLVYTGTVKDTTIEFPASPGIVDVNATTPFLDGYTVPSTQIQNGTLLVGGTMGHPGDSPAMLGATGIGPDGNRWVGFSQKTTLDSYLVFQPPDGLAVAFGKVEWTENNTATYNQITKVWTTTLNHPADNWTVNGSAVAPQLMYWGMNADTATKKNTITTNH
jgi:hypothetical protein